MYADENGAHTVRLPNGLAAIAFRWQGGATWLAFDGVFQVGGTNSGTFMDTGSLQQQHPTFGAHDVRLVAHEVGVHD